MNKRIWTEEEDNYIRENYNTLTHKSIAQKFDCSIQTVQNRMKELGLEYVRKSVPRWTPEEDNLLREYAKKYVTKTIARKLNKSYIAVQKRALKLNIELSSTKDPWKKWMIDYLKDNINVLSVNQISKFIEMTPYQINKKCKELGITIIDKNSDWTEEEIEVLKKHAMECHYTELTKYLPNRTVGAIGYKLSDLKIKHISTITTLTRKQKKYIKDNWGKKKVIDIANDLGVTFGIVERYKKELKLPNLPQEKKWTDDIIEKIRNDAKTKSQEELAKKYKTSVNQIQKIARDNSIMLKYKRVKWTDEMEEKLIKLIDEKKTRREIASELNISSNALGRRIKLLETKPKREKEVWTEEDIKSLKILSKTNFVKDIAKVLNKTEHQVKDKAKKLNIELLIEEEFWSKERVEKLIKLNKENYIHATAHELNICEQSVINKLKELNLYINYKPRTNWEPEEEKKLEELAKEMTIKEIANVLDRSSSSVGAKLRYMGLKAKKVPAAWTLEEIEKLIIMSEDYTFDQIALELNKSYEAVQNKCNKLGISRRDINAWTEEEINLLGELSKDKSPSEVAHIMGRSFDSVIYHANENNFEINYRNRPWTKEDEELLSELWGNHSIEYITKKLDRTESSIKNRVHVLNLGSPMSNFYEGISLSDVMEILNINRNKLYDWILLGLKVKSKKISSNYSYQYVTQDDLLEFLENNQELWDSKYLEKNIFGIEPEWLVIKRKQDEQGVKKMLLRKKQLILNNNYYAKESDTNE